MREIVYGGAPEEIFLQAITAVVPEFSAEETPEPAESLEPSRPRAEAEPALRPITVREAVALAMPHLERRPLLVVSDFDGTLSRIVDDPWGAQILPLGRRALRALACQAGRPRGRPVRPLVARRRRTRACRQRGLPGQPRHGARLRAASRPARATADRRSTRPPTKRSTPPSGWPTRCRASIPEPWLIVERKPPAVAFHYRTAPDTEAAGARVRAAADELDPDGVLERFPGRRVLELRPFGAVAKGEALTALIDEHRPRSVFMLGDDVSDAMAFRALRELRAAGVTDGISVAVQARSEVPAEVLAAADLVLASPVDATRFLSAIARRLDS